MKQRVIEYPDQFLRAVCLPVTIFGVKPLDTRIAWMVRLMKESGGVGIAANQAGWGCRVFVAQTAGDPEPLVFINPVLSEFEENEVAFEGCLSFPGLSLPIPRPRRLKIGYQDAYGRPQNCYLSGLQARIAHHEVDHLDGVAFHERIPLDRRFEHWAKSR